MTGARRAFAPSRRESTYGWIIDCDATADPDALDIAHPGSPWNDFGRMGPRAIPDRLRDRLRLLRGNQVAHRWRCLDDDGIVYYEGRYVGPGELMFAPLDDFARPNAGCTTIEYLDNATNQWRPL